MGPRKGVPFVGRGAPRELGMADFGATRCGNPFPRREAWQVGTALGEFVTPYVFAKSIPFRFVLPQGERIATSLRSSQ